MMFHSYLSLAEGRLVKLLDERGYPSFRQTHSWICANMCACYMFVIAEATEKHSMSRVAVAQAHDVDILIIYNKHYFPIQLTNVVLADWSIIRDTPHDIH